VEEPALKNFKNFILDLDGVLYLLNTPIPGGREFVAFLRERGQNIAFLSNNTFLTRAEYTEKLNKMGISARAEEIVTSAFVAARYLSQLQPLARVYVIGETGLKQEMVHSGLRVVTRGSADFVVVGLDRKFTFQKMKKALTLLMQGAQFIGTNPDPTYPTHDGLLPGAGAIIASIEVCSGKKAHVVGKPFPFILNFLLELRGFVPEETVIIGDRLDTDIALGNNCGVFSVLVLTGIAREEDVEKATVRPNLVVKNLFEFQEILS